MRLLRLATSYAVRALLLKLQDGTPLMYDPASKGFSMICELLLENGANPLTETRTGVSPLYIASRNGHKDVVRILLKFGADVTRVCAEVCECVQADPCGYGCMNMYTIEGRLGYA